MRAVLEVELLCSVWTMTASTRNRIYCKAVSVVINVSIQSWSPKTVGCTVVMLQGTNTRCYPLEQLGHGTLKPSLFTSYTGISLQSAQTPESPKIRFLHGRPLVSLLSPNMDNHSSSSETSL